ncbi:MAG: SDR family oxidoreductase [Chloroflexota bacterium]|nr:SDR family oxidoreductase [Chloroflexota bacterium]
MIANRPPTLRAVVVTGASSGIGRACALRLDKEGFRVFAGVRREEDAAALGRAASDRLSTIFLDVTDETSIASAVETVARAVGEAGLVALVNNAGILVPGPLEFLSVSDIRRQFEVNVFGQLAVTRAFLPLLRRGRGRIINMGSVGGKIAMPFIAPYNASKFAMEAFTDSLRMELRTWNIPVTIIEPSFIATPLWSKSRARADDTLKDLPPQANNLYGTLVDRARKGYTNLGKSAVPAEDVARAIVHVIRVRRPKARYPVGRGAWLQTALFVHVPDRLKDFLITTWLYKFLGR